MTASEGLRRKIAARREVARLDYEAYETWVYERRLRDEITDQTERLTTPMLNTFYYRVGEQGLVSDLGESVRQVFEDGYHDAQRQAMQNTDWQFEVERRRIELDELDRIDTFARDGSPDDTIAISSLSLDQSNYKGMQAIAARLGYELPDGLGSEDILATRFWLGEPPEALVVLSPCPDAVVEDGIDIGGYNRERRKMLARVITRDAPFHDELISTIRTSYDTSLTEQFGGEWYAGREAMSETNARTFITEQTDLLQDHMRIVQDVHGRVQDSDTRNAMLAGPRYNLAAALDDRLQGREEAGSLEAAGDRARSAGKDYSGDCPTGLFSAASAQSQLESLGYLLASPKAGTIDKCVNCPFCKRSVDARHGFEAHPITGKMIKTYECLTSCHAKIDKKTGERIDKIEKYALRSKKLGKSAFARAK